MAARLIELPQPRGPLSEQLFEALMGPAGGPLTTPAALDSVDPIADEDLQLALYLAYELHYTAIAGVDVQCRRVGGEQRFAARERSVSSSAGLTSTMRPPAELP